MFFSVCKFSKPSGGSSTEKPSLSCPPPRPLPPCWAISSAAPAFELLLGKTENHSYAAPNRPASCLRNDRGLGPAPKRLGLRRQLDSPSTSKAVLRRLSLSIHWEAQRQGVSWPRSCRVEICFGKQGREGAQAEVPGGGGQGSFRFTGGCSQLLSPSPLMSTQLLTFT